MSATWLRILGGMFGLIGFLVVVEVKRWWLG